MKKTIVDSNKNKVTIEGGETWRMMEQRVPPWEISEKEACFMYLKKLYFVSEVMKPNPQDIFKEFDGCLIDDFFSGVLVNFDINKGKVQFFRFYQ